MTYWPKDAGHPAVLLSLYQTRAALGVIITSPVAIVTDDQPTIAWSISSGVQVTRRVQVLSPDGLTVVFSSGPTVTASQSVAVTAGLLHTGIVGYIIRVEVLNDVSLIGVGFATFDTTFQPSVPVSGVHLTPFGDKCTIGDDPELPGVRVRWTRVVPGVGETFRSYSVVRRVDGEATWEVIRTIADITVTRYDDYTFAPRATLEYGVIWTAANGADTLVSLPQTPAPRARIDFDWTFMHDVLDPRNWVVYFSLEQQEDVQSDRTFQRLWGRQQPTLFIGEDEHSVFRMKALPDGYGGDVWDGASTLFSRQRLAGSTICVRNGIAGYMKFCSFDSLSRDMGQAQYSADAQLVETFFDESTTVSG